MAIAWVQEGILVRKVARRLTVSHSVIQRLLACFHTRFHATGQTDEAPLSGQPCLKRHNLSKFEKTQV